MGLGMVSLPEHMLPYGAPATQHVGATIERRRGSSRGSATPRGDLKRVKFGKKTLFNAADLASFLTKLGRLSEADAHRVGHARDASKSIEQS
jgi:hypothetical protein